MKGRSTWYIVHCSLYRVGVRYSECPLKEVLLYIIHSHNMQHMNNIPNQTVWSLDKLLC